MTVIHIIVLRRNYMDNDLKDYKDFWATRNGIFSLDKVARQQVPYKPSKGALIAVLIPLIFFTGILSYSFAGITLPNINSLLYSFLVLAIISSSLFLLLEHRVDSQYDNKINQFKEPYLNKFKEELSLKENINTVFSFLIPYIRNNSPKKLDTIQRLTEKIVSNNISQKELENFIRINHYAFINISKNKEVKLDRKAQEINNILLTHGF